MSNFVCFHAIWNEIKLADGEGIDEVAMQERADIVTAFLGEYPFTHFETESGWVKAFADENDINPEDYLEIEENVSDYIDLWSWSIVERENWNELWEKNFFNPLLVGQFFVRAPFHEPAPEGRRLLCMRYDHLLPQCFQFLYYPNIFLICKKFSMSACQGSK